jgi:transcriptional regulator with XRE-family HTH domain
LPKSQFSRAYDDFRRLLVQARLDAGLTQVHVAEKLRRTQSFVSDYERGQRRLDIIEFLEIARVIRVDPHEVIRQIQR